MPELSFRALLRVSLAALLLAASAAAQSARPGGAARTTTTSARSNNARGGSGRSNTTNSASRGSNGQHQYRSNTELGDAIITIDPETRSLVIVTDEDTHRELTGVIKSLDQPKPQVLIKVVFLEVTYNQGLDVGIEGSYTARIKSPLAATTGSRTTTGNTTTTNNGTTTIGASPTGSTGTTSTTTSTTKTNNGRTTTTSSTTNSASPGSTFAGTNGSNGTNTVATTLTETLGTAAKIGETAALSSLFGSPLTGSFVKLVSDDWSATLHALASKGKLEVLSRPSIMARNNQEAVIVVGSEVPFITNSRITDQGQTINTIQYDNVGIILRVTPFITSGNKVEMIVAPEISSLTDQTVPISNNASAPVIAKRSAETVIVTPHGQTAVIGGLMETQKTETVQKIPILGDIPILGIPFRRTIKQDQKRELLIFLTPYIVNDAQDLAQATNDEVAKANLPQKAFTPEDFGKYLDDLPLPTDGEKPYRGPVATPIPAKKPASAPKAVKVKASAL